MRLKIFSLLLAFCWCLQFSPANGQTHQKITSLSDDWLVYSESYKTFVPYLEGEYQSLHLWLDVARYKQYKLSFQAVSGTSVFVNGKLFKVIDTNGIVHLDFQELMKLSSGDKSLITFFNAGEKLPYTSIWISSIVDDAPPDSSIVSAVLRSGSGDSSFPFVTFIIFMVSIAILKNAFPKRFREMTSFRRLAQGSISEEQSAPFAFFSSTGSLALLFCAGSVALVFVILNRNEVLTAYGQLYNFLTAGILVVLMFVFRYLLINILAGIFNISSVSAIHFQETMRAGFLFMLLGLPLFAVVEFSNVLDLNFSYIHFFYIILIFFSIMLLRLMFLIFSFSNFRNIYLFSYLCVSEILPLVIVLKIILVVQ